MLVHQSAFSPSVSCVAPRPLPNCFCFHTPYRAPPDCVQVWVRAHAWTPSWMRVAFPIRISLSVGVQSFFLMLVSTWAFVVCVVSFLLRVGCIIFRSPGALVRKFVRHLTKFHYIPDAIMFCNEISVYSAYSIWCCGGSFFQSHNTILVARNFVMKMWDNLPSKILITVRAHAQFLFFFIIFPAVSLTFAAVFGGILGLSIYISAAEPIFLSFSLSCWMLFEESYALHLPPPPPLSPSLSRWVYVSLHSLFLDFATNSL